ncbi:DUF4179 domain-containing protein [Paenibacillus sp. GSMTC-2017]|uniref:DUF4179 domain-containing protein n=1 Tax=Paenibacillus sp. GSMTC-2017 TaxID=2794350 RepID=UPI0018D97059|nr:DUF4179 domain-containing protein [Paenibacillus sp. GSMTC-2017]MBH5316513.1 DUF4179 domain-containing protein [Paenibacillus sp. GSMTC-2017]
MTVHDPIRKEIEKLAIPKELHERSKMGIQQAKREIGRTSITKKVAKGAAITVAGVVLVVSLGAAASPTFAEYVKSWFTLYKTDDGIKKAVSDGFAVPINKEVSDQGITFKVKEAIHDELRVSLLYGIERDGKSIDSDRLFDTFIPNGPDDDPYVNRYEVVDKEGNVLPLKLQHTQTGSDRILTLTLQDFIPGRSHSSLSELPDQIIVRFDINQIGSTYGKWQLEVPLDLTKAKAATAVVSINKRYESPLGFSIDFNQLRHGTSTSEIMLQVHETQAWRSAMKSAPMFRYEVKDRGGNIVAVHDGLNRKDLISESVNTIDQGGYGTLGHMKYRHSFVPFEDTEELTLSLTAIYSQEQVSSGIVLPVLPELLKKEPLVKEVNGKKVTLKARTKSEEQSELLNNGQTAFEGKGWILELDQQLGSDTLDMQWSIVDEQGKLIMVESVTAREEDEQGNDYNRTMFFFADQTSLPRSLSLNLNSWTKIIPVNWSISLVSSTESLPQVDYEPIYEMTVEQVERTVVDEAERAMRELMPNKQAEMYGVADYGNRWLLYTKDNSGSLVIMDKATTEPISVQRSIPYHELESELRKSVEDTLRAMNPEQSFVAMEVVREKSDMRNQWIIHNEGLNIVVDAATGKVKEALISYAAGALDEKVKTIAEEAYEHLSNGKSLTATDMKQRWMPNRHVWEIYREGSLLAQVDVRTNNLVLVEQSFKDDYPGDESAAKKLYAKGLYTKEQAIAKVSSIIEQLFAINLQDYDMSIQMNEYTFSKKGATSIRGTVNARGEFWKIEQLF